MDVHVYGFCPQHWYLINSRSDIWMSRVFMVSIGLGICCKGNEIFCTFCQKLYLRMQEHLQTTLYLFYIDIWVMSREKKHSEKVGFKHIPAWALEIKQYYYLTEYSRAGLGSDEGWCDGSMYCRRLCYCSCSDLIISIIHPCGYVLVAGVSIEQFVEVALIYKIENKDSFFFFSGLYIM